MIPVEREQKIVALAREMRSAGMSLRAVAAELARLGFTSRTGKPFVHGAIANMTEAA